MLSFAEEINALLDDSVLLVTTEGGTLVYGTDKPVVRESYAVLNGADIYAKDDTLAERLKKYSGYALERAKAAE